MGTVSFEVPGPGTYQVQCDPKLDPLSNSGTAADVLTGKQFYNDQNQVVTGTLVPAAPTYAGVLVVTVDAGAEVTATDGTTTLTATSTGTAIFHLPNGGTWTVSATLNGNHSPPETVDMQENFSLTLSPGGTASVNVPSQYTAELSFSKPSRLPDGYTEVEYISNPNAGWIVTNISGYSPFTYRIEIVMRLVDETKSGSIYGSQYYQVYNNGSISNHYSYLYFNATNRSLGRHLHQQRSTLKTALTAFFISLWIRKMTTCFLSILWRIHGLVAGIYQAGPGIAICLAANKIIDITVMPR